MNVSVTKNTSTGMRSVNMSRESSSHFMRDENRNHIIPEQGRGTKVAPAPRPQPQPLMGLPLARKTMKHQPAQSNQPTANFFERKPSTLPYPKAGNTLQHSLSLDSSPPAPSRAQSRLSSNKSSPDIYGDKAAETSPENRFTRRLKKPSPPKAVSFVSAPTPAQPVAAPPRPALLPTPNIPPVKPKDIRVPNATPSRGPSGRISAQSRLEKNRLPAEPKVQVVVDAEEGSNTALNQKRLLDFCRGKNWKEPTYLIYKNSYLGKINRASTVKKVGYSCTVKIGIPRQSFRLPEENFQLSTFDSPDFVTPADAKEHAALKALDKLKEREILYNAPIIKDTPTIIERLIKILGSKASGIFAPVIEDEYRLEFKQLLPDYWFDIISYADEFYIEELKGTSSPCYVVMLKEKTEASESFGGNLVIPSLAYPPGTTWDVFITAGTSVSNVHLRFIGDEYSSRFEAFTASMEDWYANRTNRCLPNYSVGELLAAFFEKLWWRVVVIGLEGESVRVKFIDLGDEQKVSRSSLFKLERQFYTLPAQAISVSLKGLEEFSNRRETEDFLVKTIIGKSLVGCVEELSPTISLTLYDTSQDEEAINLNETLRQLFELDYGQLPQFEVGIFYNMTLTNVELDGTVCVQVANDGLTLLNELLQFYTELDCESLSDYSQVFKNKIYLAQQHEDNTFYRVKPVSCDPLDSKIQVFLVDYGKYSYVFLEDLVQLRDLSLLLEQIPEQAIRINLHDVPRSLFSPAIRDRLLKFASEDPDVAIVGKVVEFRGALPIVELFRKTSAEKWWASVNQTLIVEENIVKTAEELDRFHISSPSPLSSPEPPAPVKFWPPTPGGGRGTPKPVGGRAAPLPPVHRPTTPVSHFSRTPPAQAHPTKVKGTIDIISQIIATYPVDSIERILAQNRPELPDLDGYFDIFINSTASPSNFLLSPSTYLPSLNKVMDEMNTYYNSHQIQTILKEGNLCAAKDGNFWYRAFIDKIIDHENISVKVIDYGCLKLTSSANVKPLLDTFAKHPYIGFSAKLHGIAPTHGDWSVEDSILMKNLVHDKIVRAKLKDIFQSRQGVGGILLSLELYIVDDSGLTRNIADHFVKLRHAVYE